MKQEKELRPLTTDEKTEKDDSETACKRKDIFSTEEFRIEEVAIDGICGVY